MQTMDPTITPVQQYKDSTFEEAKAAGCDLLQLKYDGWNARIEQSYGTVNWYSKQGRMFQRCMIDDQMNAIAYGEAMFGTQWSKQPAHAGKTYVYDLYALNGEVISRLTYRERYSLLRTTMPRFPRAFELVPCFPIDRFAEIWENHVKSGLFEGVVFRRKTDTFNTVLLRQKDTVTCDLLVVGFKEGDGGGKYAGQLGALVGRTKEGVLVDVGGGFSDPERYEIYANQAKYLNKWFEAEARARFASGSLRHPNFNRWRPDLDT